MKRIILAGALAVLAVIGGGVPSSAQQAQLYCRQADGGAFLPVQPGQPCPVTIAGGTAVIGSVTISGSSSASAAITSVVTAAGAASQVLKASAGNLYSVYATNLTGTAGFLAITNTTTAPSSGAITPLACAPLPANGVASINYAPGPAQRYSTGITAVVTSATTCYTYTTGVITAFISGAVQ